MIEFTKLTLEVVLFLKVFLLLTDFKSENFFISVLVKWPDLPMGLGVGLSPQLRSSDCNILALKPN